MPVSEPSYLAEPRYLAFDGKVYEYTPTWTGSPSAVKVTPEAEVERLREAGDRLRSTLDINLGCGHVDARAASHDDCPYCRAKRSALDAWDGALRALNAR